MTIELNHLQFRRLYSLLNRELYRLKFYSEEWEDHPYLKQISKDLDMLVHKSAVDKSKMQSEYDELYNVWDCLSKINEGDTIKIKEEKNEDLHG